MRFYVWIILSFVTALIVLCGIYSVRVLGISAFSFISQQNTQRHIDNMGNGQLDIFNSSADTQNTQTHLQQIDSGHLKKSPERSADFVKKQGECCTMYNITRKI